MACLVSHPAPLPAEEEEEEEVTLTAGVTENKKVTDTDAKGQLLSSMDKVAGDLAYMHITHTEKPVLFNVVQISVGWGWMR